MVTSFFWLKAEVNKDRRGYVQFIKVLHAHGIEPGFSADASYTYIHLLTPITKEQAEQFNFEAQSRIHGLSDE